MSEFIHPNAWLLKKRNVASGLRARSQVLTVLERGEMTISDVVEKTGMSYIRVLRHLHLLEGSGVVERDSKHRPYKWSLTGLGQRRLSL